MSDRYIGRLIQMIQEEINHPRYEDVGVVCELEINRLLNNIASEVGLSLRFYHINDDLIKITCDCVECEYIMFPEVIARFREQYPVLVNGI